MLITNGIISRNVSPARLAEYGKKGYAEVKMPETKTTPKKGKETAKAE